MPDDIASSSAVPRFDGHLAGLIKWLLGDLPQDLVGITIGDWLHELRLRNLRTLSARSSALLASRKIEPKDYVFDPVFAKLLIEAAADESDEELLELWSRLLAASLDAKRTTLARRSFVALMKQLDALDAKILNHLSTIFDDKFFRGTSPSELASQLGCHYFSVRVSLQRLVSLHCVFKCQWGGREEERFALDELGLALMRPLHASEFASDTTNQTNRC